MSELQQKCLSLDHNFDQIIKLMDKHVGQPWDVNTDVNQVGH